MQTNLSALLLMVGAVGLASATGCNRERDFTVTRTGSVAVVVGDFDDIQGTFNRLEVDTVRYDGIISTATWVEDENDFAQPSVPVEALFLSERNREFNEHRYVFISSGTRGMGERRYNSLQPDNEIVSNDDAVANALAYVRSGGVMVVTDWSYDLVERIFPDAIDFLGDDEVFDAAQRGDIGRYQARVVDESLRERLELDEDSNLSLEMDFSNWAIMTGVDESDALVKVWMRGDVVYRDDSGEGTRSLEDVPLLVTIDTPGDNRGRLVFSSFHLDTQNPAVVDAILDELVGGLDNLTTTIRQSGSTE